MKRAMRRFQPAARPGIVSFVGHYVFSGQRHFASTIFADQILIVGWRLSKEAWSPVGSLSATRCTNALAFFFLLFLFPPLSLPLLLPPSPRLYFSVGSAMHLGVLSLFVSPYCVSLQTRCSPRVYANCIELPERDNNCTSQTLSFSLSSCLVSRLVPSLSLSHVRNVGLLSHRIVVDLKHTSDFFAAR